MKRNEADFDGGGRWDSSDNPVWSKPLARLIKEGAMISFFAFSAYLMIALATYQPADPGWSHVGQSQHVLNSAGKTGAWSADVLLSLFGYLAYLFPLMIVYRAWLVFRDKERGRWNWLLAGLRALGFVLTLVAGTGLAKMYFIESEYLPASTGGILGTVIGEFMLSGFNLLGATLILLALFFIGMTIFTDLSWIWLMDMTGKLTLEGVSKLKNAVRASWQKSINTIDEKKKQNERKAIFEQQKIIIDKKPAPAIAAKPKPIQVSARVEREKQKSLFKSTSKGELPPLSLLDQPAADHKKGYSSEALEGMSKLLEIKLKDFGVVVEVVAVIPGPVVTRFEIQPAAGVKASRITNLAKDLARSLAVVSVRVVEVIAGKTVVGIEIPNEEREMIMLSEVLSSSAYDDAQSHLTVALGKDISGNPIVADLAKMPHLLVAGTTGSGKSVGLNAMLISTLFKCTPDQVRLIMIDPKMLELSVYDDIPHLLTPVVTDMSEAANALRWCVAEMERRYRLMASLGVRNLAGFNRKVNDAIKNENPIPDPLWKSNDIEGEVAPTLDTLPLIVVVIDEFADMMMIVGKKVEVLIARIAQKARAAGIHLILATQRPSVDVITGLIKANVPTRIAFQVSSKVDSRTIIDQGGAEQLLGHGDMLYLPPGTGLPVRVHGAFVSDEEVHRVCDDWRARGEPDYLTEVLEGTHEAGAAPGFEPDGQQDSEQDALYDEAVAFVTQSRRASISSVQRRLKIGYNRAARMIESMEASGVVTEMQSNGQREVLAPPPVEA
ncbi:MAG: DNA translocase FtsK 4TM domain-containing protein [Pseudomonadales bacterium]|nr:DNA translocase FtsK 4TM domain-containing protein [Pseudomonadales bacterium]